MTSTSDSSASVNTGALSRLLATSEPEAGAEERPEILLSAVLDAATEGLIVVSDAGQVLTYNDRFVEIWGVPRQTLLTRDASRVLAAQISCLSDPADFVGTVEAVSGGAMTAEGACRFTDGRVVEWEARPVEVAGRTVGRVWTYRDVTERVRAFELLHESEERFRIFADSAAYGLAMHQGRELTYANPAVSQVAGYSIEELLTMPFWELVPLADRERVRERGAARLQSLTPSGDRYEGSVLRKDGQVRLVEFGVSTMRLRDKQTVVVTLVDVTDRRRAEAEALHLASHDQVTDLPNRASFRTRTDAAIEEARRSGAEVSLAIVGLDRFKSANFLGHRLGDLVLQEAGRRLYSLVRPADVVARLGSDEFALLLRGCDKGSTFVLSQHIVARLREIYRVSDDNEIFLSASVGTATFPQDAADAGELLRHANIALLAAKERGKDQSVAFEADLTGDADARQEMNRLLHRSLRDHAFFLEYQPIARTHDLGVTGFEALVRSKDLLGRRVPPNAFIPIAEATGLVVPLGRIILDLALAAIRELNLLRATPLRVAINASAIQFRHPAFVSDIKSGLDRHGLPASALAVEITETNALTDPEGTHRVLRELRAAGVSISLDDFGTGFASLDLLRSLPLDVVKIDGSFIRDVDTDQKQAAIATSVIELSHKLGLRVVAEGVETESQRRFLLDHNCDLIQGYWLARPLSLEGGIEFLKSSERRVRA